MKRIQQIALRFASAACVAAAGLVWMLPAPSGAAGSVEAGWWYRYSGSPPQSSASAPSGEVSGAAVPPTTLPISPIPPPVVTIPELPGAPAPVPPPANIPEGGLYIANDATGPSAVAAVRFPVTGVGEARITLAFAEGSVGGGPITLVVCPILEGFQAVANGGWADRPADDCARLSTSGAAVGDGSTIIFTLPQGFQTTDATTLDAFIAPAPGDGTVFSVVFNAPTAEALEVTAPPAPFTPNNPAPFRPDPAAPAASFNSGLFPLGAGPAPFIPPSPNAGGPGTGAGVDSSGGGGSESAAERIANVLDVKPWARWVSTVLLVVLGGWFFIASGAGDKAPLLALVRRGSGDERDRGIGRFSRSRAGTPRSLR